MLSVFILTLIQSSFSLTDDSTASTLPQNQLQLTEYGEYVTFIDEELHIPIISTGTIEIFYWFVPVETYFWDLVTGFAVKLRL